MLSSLGAFAANLFNNDQIRSDEVWTHRIGLFVTTQEGSSLEKIKTNMRVSGFFKNGEMHDLVISPQTTKADIAKVTRTVLQTIKDNDKQHRTKKTLVTVYYNGLSRFNQGLLEIPFPEGYFPLQKSMLSATDEGEALIWFIFDTERKSSTGATAETPLQCQNILI